MPSQTRFNSGLLTWRSFAGGTHSCMSSRLAARFFFFYFEAQEEEEEEER
jgi:hypothetical protein